MLFSRTEGSVTLSCMWLAALALGCSTVARSQAGTEAESTASASEALEADVLARVTGDRNDEVVAFDHDLAGSSNYSKLKEDGTTYSFVENGLPLSNIRHAPPGQVIRMATDVPCAALGHGNCLLFNGYGTPTDFAFTDKDIRIGSNENWSNDRLELILSHGAGEAIAAGAQPDPQSPNLHFGRKRYLRYYVRIGDGFVGAAPRACPPSNQFTPSDDEFIMTQVWQVSSNAPGHGPVFAVYLFAYPADPNKVLMSFRVRNGTGSHEEDTACGHEFHTELLNRNQWYNFYFQLIPNYIGNPTQDTGSILIWRDVDMGSWASITDQQARNFNEPHDFYWGYAPQAGWQTHVDAHNNYDLLGDRFELRVGLYRSGNSVAPSKHQPVYFDSIKMSMTLEALSGL